MSVDLVSMRMEQHTARKVKHGHKTLSSDSQMRCLISRMKHRTKELRSEHKYSNSHLQKAEFRNCLRFAYPAEATGGFEASMLGGPV